MEVKIDWTQLAAMIVVLSAVSAVIQLLLSKVLIQPQVTQSIKDAMGDMKKWAEGQFPSQLTFQQHADLDVRNHGEITRVVSTLVEDQTEDHGKVERLSLEMVAVQTTLKQQRDRRT